jgi:response regulator of citrate/malate metabolism
MHTAGSNQTAGGEDTMITLAKPIDADTLRVRHEFLAMPGLVLTAAQTARLYALSTAHAKALLETLEEEHFLMSDPNGVYRRALPPASH